MAITIKSAREIAIMREAGQIVAAVLASLRQAVRPGVTTADLDRLVEREIRTRGAVPSFKGYRNYPASICASVNEEIVHGIPGRRVLREGDIVSLDVGVIYRGYQGDSAVTLPVGQVDPKVQELLEVTRGALYQGIAAARGGAHLSDIGSAVQCYVEQRGFSVVREYVGHGIGRQMHEEPQIPNFGDPGHGPVLRPGMTLAIEPMVNIGDWRTRVQSDGWTVVTADGSLSAHFEHTIVVTEEDPEILTEP